MEALPVASKKQLVVKSRNVRRTYADEASGSAVNPFRSTTTDRKEDGLGAKAHPNVRDLRNEVGSSDEASPCSKKDLSNPKSSRENSWIKEEYDRKKKSYMNSYATWSSEINRTKDDDEMTIAAPETMAQENLPELSVMCEKYDDSFEKSAKLKPKNTQLSFSTYTCCFCPLTFRTKETLSDHKQTKHNATKKLETECPDCGQMFVSRYQMRLHAIRHKGNLLISCPTCGIQFITQNELTAHLKNNGCRLTSFGKCQYCDRTFSRRGRYIFHLKKLHPDKPIPVLNESEAPIIPRATILPNPKNYSDIRRTDRGANSPTIEERGRFVVMLEPLDIQSNRSSDDALSEPPLSPQDQIEKLVCTLCFERFDDLPAYNTHMVECFNPNDYTGQAPPPYELCKCVTCIAVFEAVDPFVQHLREHRLPLQIKPHDCVQCSIGQQPKFLLHPHSPSMILGD